MLFGKPLTIIAEVGINHEGSLSVAKEMARAAVGAGADVVKFQTHIPEAEMHEGAKSLLMPNGETMWDHFSRCALSEDQERDLFLYVERELGSVFMSTPFSVEAVERLERIGVRAHKIGSGEAMIAPIVDAVLATGKTVLLSTGLAEDPYAMYPHHNVIPMACACEYPAPPESHAPFRDQCGGWWGYSDHSEDGGACIAAAALGACVIERHFTDRPNVPDSSVSSFPGDFARLARWCRAVSEDPTRVPDLSVVKRYAGRRLVDGVWKRPA